MSYHQFRNLCGDCNGSGQITAEEYVGSANCTTCGGAGYHKHGSFEVFEVKGGDAPGWYWWSCSPGCSPDGEAEGPYRTEHDAIAFAQEVE